MWHTRPQCGCPALCEIVFVIKYATKFQGTTMCYDCKQNRDLILSLIVLNVPILFIFSFTGNFNFKTFNA